MPRSEAQFEAMRRSTRDKLQAAGSRLFAQKGVAGTGVQELAQSAGISVGLLYRHYKTKEELFDELVDFARIGLSQLTECFLAAGDPLEILTSLTEDVAAQYREDSRFVEYMLFLSQAMLAEPQRPSVAALLEEDKRRADALAALIARGQQLGQFRSDDPHSLAFAYLSMFQGIGIFCSTMPGTLQVPAAEILLRILR